MVSEIQNATDFRITSLVISRPDGSNPLAISKIAAEFSYIENIKYPCVMGTLVLVDSAGLLNRLPIQGGENVKIRLKTAVSKNEVELNMRVWKIAGRYAKNKDQLYTLNLISEELLNNETVRVLTPLNGKPNDIIKSLISNNLKSKKSFFSEPCLMEVKLLAARKRIFDIISMLLPRSVSQELHSAAEIPSVANQVNKSLSKIPPTQKEGEQKPAVGGSAGFLFWENRRGFNFFSVDTLCSNKESKYYKFSKPWGPYVEIMANQDAPKDERFTIGDIRFDDELDLVTSLRMGRYSTLMCFFNHSTGQYDEVEYNIKKAFKSQKHLGSQTEPTVIKIGKTETLADYPTRMITALLDHETWYNEAKPASPYPQDGAVKPTPYGDRQLEWAAQAIARYDSLANQTATMIIPGNIEICAGDKVDIRLASKLPDASKTTTPWDTENSGVYLVVEASHTFSQMQGANGRFTTTLRIARDTHGMQDASSNHGTK
jgi:hypothetical protein